jgi:hypothetical protein
VNGNCGKNETPPPTTTSSTPSPPPGQQAVLGTKESGTTPTPAPESTSGTQKVLGESESGGTAPAAAKAPASAVEARQAGTNKSLPFTGTDLIVVLLTAAIALTGGLALRRLVTDRQ